ncbi:hypothetical protein ACLOJK_001591 [Asimina triloba]
MPPPTCICFDIFSLSVSEARAVVEKGWDWESEVVELKRRYGRRLPVFLPIVVLGRQGTLPCVQLRVYVGPTEQQQLAIADGICVSPIITISKCRTGSGSCCLAPHLRSSRLSSANTCTHVMLVSTGPFVLPIVRF